MLGSFCKTILNVNLAFWWLSRHILEFRNLLEWHNWPGNQDSCCTLCWALSAFRNLLTNGLSPRMPIKWKIPRNQTLFLPERPSGVTHSTRISTPPFRPPRLEPERKGRFQVFFGGKFCYQFYFVMKMENLITTPQAKWLLNGTSAPRCHLCPG